MMQTKSLFLASAALFLSACGQDPSSEVRTDCESAFYSNQACEVLTWEKGSTVDFEYAADFPQEYQKFAIASSETYNNFLGDLNIQASRKGNTSSSANYDELSQDEVNGIYFITGEWPWKDSHSSSQAMTVVRFIGKRIKTADIFIRGTSFGSPENMQQEPALMRSKPVDASPYNSAKVDEFANSSLGAQSLYMLFLHEMGHAIGRKHSDEKESIMFPVVNVQLLYKPFSQSDLTNFGSVYSIH